MRLPAAIRQLRERLGKSQAEFAHLLRCSQNSVSRYESGQVSPGLGPLLRLHDISKGEERDFFAAQIKTELAPRYGFNPAASIDVLRGVIEDAAIEDLFLQNIPPSRHREWQPLAEVIAALLSTDRIVDESVVEILRLWERNYNSPRVKALLRDIVGYLRVQLAAPGGDKKG